MKHTPRKRFGQHFLGDPGVIAAIVAAIAPAPDDNMLEIGPGLGALTQPLAAVLRRLHVIEIDRDIVLRLQRSFAPERLSIHAGDVLKFDLSQLPPRLRVVGNLPYNISTPVLFHLAAYAGRVLDMHFMLQKEVVQRMVARAGSGDYGRLSVMLQYRFDIEDLFAVPRTAFTPAPQVESAVVRLRPRAPERLTAERHEVLEQVVRAAFSQRRKTLRNALARVISAPELAALGIDPGARAETLPVDAYVAISNRLAAGAGDGVG